MATRSSTFRVGVALAITSAVASTTLLTTPAHAVTRTVERTDISGDTWARKDEGTAVPAISRQSADLTKVTYTRTDRYFTVKWQTNDLRRASYGAPIFRATTTINGTKITMMARYVTRLERDVRVLTVGNSKPCASRLGGGASYSTHVTLFRVPISCLPRGVMTELTATANINAATYQVWDKTWPVKF